MLFKRGILFPHVIRSPFISVCNELRISCSFTTLAQNTQFRTRNILLSKQKPTRTQDYKLINPKLEEYKRESSRLLRKYYRKYAAGKDKRVEAGKERRKKREVRDKKWNAYETWVEKSLNPLKFMSVEQKKIWDKNRKKIEARRIKKEECGKLRLYLHMTPVVQQRQKTVAQLLQMAESGHQFITTMEQAEKAIDHALMNPTNYNISWEKMIESEEKLREELSKQPCLRRPLPKINTRLFPRGLKDVIPKYRRSKQILPSCE